MWRDKFESPTFIDDMDALWEQVKPLYEELHTYAGNKLKELYGDQLDMSDGLIPAHIFGNLISSRQISKCYIKVCFR